MGRKFWKTRITVEVLTEDEPVPTDIDLESICRECITGDWSMGGLTFEPTELSPEEAAKALIAQGSDPDFFSLTEDGKDTLAEEEDDEPADS